MRYCEKCGKPLEDDEICGCDIETIEVKEVRRIVYQDPSKEMWKVILTAVIYPAIAIGISFVSAYSYIGLGLSILLNFIGALCIYFGGFTLLVIPLPFIYLFRVGCIKKYLPLWKRIVFGILAFVCIFGSTIIASLI